MVVIRNVLDRKRAESLHKTIGGLLRDEVPQLPSERSRQIFWRLMLESIEKNVKPKREPKPDRKPASYDEALSYIEEIDDLAGSICTEGEDFAASVQEKAEDIGKSVERYGSATPNQLLALQNMLEGLQRWFYD